MYSDESTADHAILPAAQSTNANQSRIHITSIKHPDAKNQYTTSPDCQNRKMSRSKQIRTIGRYDCEWHQKRLRSAANIATNLRPYACIDREKTPLSILQRHHYCAERSIFFQKDGISISAAVLVKSLSLKTNAVIYSPEG